MTSNDLEEIYQYIQSRNLIVPKDIWMDYLDDCIDGSSCIGDAVSNLYEYLSKNYTAGNGGKVLLEPIDKFDLETYKKWFIDMYEDLEYSSVHDLLDELNYTPFVPSDTILEIYVDPILMSKSELQDMLKTGIDPDWERKSNALRSMKRYRERSGG